MHIPGDTKFYWIRDINPALVVKLKQPILVYHETDGDQTMAWTGSLPTKIVSRNWQGAVDALLMTMRDRFIRLHANRERIAPDLYDEYRALSEYIAL